MVSISYDFVLKQEFDKYSLSVFDLFLWFIWQFSMKTQIIANDITNLAN